MQAALKLGVRERSTSQGRAPFSSMHQKPQVSGSMFCSIFQTELYTVCTI